MNEYFSLYTGLTINLLFRLGLIAIFFLLFGIDGVISIILLMAIFWLFGTATRDILIN